MPFRNVGPMELVLLLAILLLILGPGRIGRLGAELGKGIRGFRDGLGASKKESQPESTEDTERSEE